MQREPYLFELALKSGTCQHGAHCQRLTMELYRATAGMAEGAACLTTDWVLGGIAKTKNVAQQRYRDFVQQGKGQASHW